jgi:hypoxanthine phosphoribosyltransferase
MSAPKLADALATSHVVHDRATLEAAILRMADDIRAEYADGDVPVFLTVMNGGLPFAAQLAFALGERGLDLQFD